MVLNLKGIYRVRIEFNIMEATMAYRDENT